MSLNLSGAEFWQEGLADSVRTALTRSGLDPHNLRLEITESVLMDHLPSAYDTCELGTRARVCYRRLRTGYRRQLPERLPVDT
jgi:EAL domain-containing protein (putative c-di-GMP-specific phosphodiesterase class I)